jgi:phage gpG-like protein
MLRGWILDDEVRDLSIRLQNVPAKVLQNLKPVMEGLAKQLRDSARSLAPRKKGSLRGSIWQKVTVNSDSIVARVGASKPYAHLMEYGYQGNESVKAYERKNVVKLFGRDLKKPIDVLIKAHTRNVDYPQRSYLRWALRGMDMQIRRDVENAVQKTVNEES